MAYFDLRIGGDLAAGMLDLRIYSTESFDSLPPIINYIYCLQNHFFPPTYRF